MNVLVPVFLFLHGKLQAFRLRQNEISHTQWPNANCMQAHACSCMQEMQAHASHFFIIRLEDLPHRIVSTINNNSGPGINLPNPHQIPASAAPITLAPLPIADWQPRAERVTAGGRSQAGPGPTGLASASIQYSRPAHSGSARQFRAHLFVELFLLVKTYSRRLN